MIWLDAHLSPRIAKWLELELDFAASSLTRLGLSKCEDAEIFEAAREAGVVFLTKDSDFLDGQLLKGSPRQLLLVSTGNIPNRELLPLILLNLARIEEAFFGSNLVEITRERLIVR